MNKKGYYVVKVFLYFFCIVFISNTTFANNLKNFSYHVKYTYDESSKKSLKQIIDEEFKDSNLKINYPNRLGVHWFKIDIQNNSNKDIDLIVANTKSFFETFIFYEIDNYGNIIRKSDASRDTQYRDRDYKSKNPAFLLTLKENQTSTIIVKAKAEMYFYSELVIQEEELFKYSELKENYFYVLFFGSCFAITIYILILYLLNREKIYLYYSFFLISLFNLAMIHSNIYVYFNTYWLNVALVINPFTFIFLLLMSLEMLDNNVNKKIIAKVIAGFNILLIISSCLMLYDKAIASIFTHILMSVGFLISIYLFLNSTKNNRIYFLAQIVFTSSILCLPLISLEVIPFNFFTKNMIFMGAFIEIVLFSIILGNRINFLKQAELDANKKISFLQKEENEKLENKVKEQTKFLNTLLKELQHRVKNNLQFITSFIWIQKQSIKQEEAIVAFNQIQDRINAIVYLFDNINEYESENTSLKTYLVKIINPFERTNKNVKIEYEIEESIKLDYDRAISIGLITNELITNSFKYAFFNIEKPTIQINISKVENRLSYLYKDNGVGVQTDIIDEAKGYGYKLINEFISKLQNVKKQIDGNDGFKFQFTFNLIGKTNG